MVYLTVYSQMPLDPRLLIKMHLQDRCVSNVGLCKRKKSGAKIVVQFLYFFKKRVCSPHQYRLLNIIFNLRVN